MKKKVLVVTELMVCVTWWVVKVKRLEVSMLATWACIWTPATEDPQPDVVSVRSEHTWSTCVEVFRLMVMRLVTLVSDA